MADFPPPPDTPAPPFGRTRHPFFMHEMIRRQTVAVQATLGVLPETAKTIPSPAANGRLLLTGIGTSFHAALGVTHMATRWASDRFHSDSRPAFDVLDDASLLDGLTMAVVFSSSGETAVTNAVLALLRERKVPSVLVTGVEESTGSRLADHRLVTRYALETSWTHTVSYTSALAAGLVLVRAWLPEPAPAAPDPALIVDAVEQSLSYEERVLELVERLSPARDLLILGSGAAETTAREAALKLREATGRFVATGGVEEFLHGMLPSVSDSTAVIAVSGTPLECRRAREGLGAAARLGSVTQLIDSSGSAGEEGEWSLPTLPPEVAPISQIVPFQLIAYWLAVSDGRNPDVMALDDPRYLEARSSFGI